MTMPTTVIVGRVVPAAKGALLFVQVIFCPTGAAQTQPVPNAPTGTTPAGTVSVTEIGEVSSVPAATLGVTE